MTLNYVTLTLDLYDGQGNPVIAGSAAFTPSAVLTDAGVEVIGQQPVTAVFHAAGLPTVKLLATDNSGPAPAGWTWSAAFSGITGAPAAFSFFLPFTGGASQLLSNLIPVSSGTAFQAYMPLPTGTPSSGQVPVATGTGEGSAWGNAAVLDGNASDIQPVGTSLAAGSAGKAADASHVHTAAGRLLTDRGAIAASTAYSPGDMVAYQGQRVLITTAVTSSTWPNWFTPPTLTAGTYIPITSQAVFYAADWGVVADGVTDNAPALNRALQFMSKGLNSGGFLVLPDGYEPNGAITGVSSTVIIPPGCYITGGGPEVSVIRLNANANCDVVQFQTNGSSSQATLINAATGAGPAAGSIRNAFYSGLIHLTVHGNKTAQGKSQYNYGVNMTTNPAVTEAGTDPDFDPTNLLMNVEIRSCTGDGFIHVGRGQLRVTGCVSRYNDGHGYVPSFDSLYTGCNAGENGLGGFYLNHQSTHGAANKSYNNGQAAQWASGSNYAAGAVVMNSGGLYRAISALTNDTTAPASDATNWAHLTGATAPAAWGYGFWFDTNAGENAWTACDGQENAAGDYYVKGCTSVALQGVSNRPFFGGVTNSSDYASLTLDAAVGCIADISFSTLASLAYALRMINAPTACDVRMAGDATYQAVLSPDSALGTANAVRVNGTTLAAPGVALIAGDLGGTSASPQVVATHLASPLPLIQGGTGQVTAAAGYNALSPMTTTGDIEYESGAATASRLAGNTTSTKNFLTSTGSGGNATAPAWGTIAAGDLPAGTTSTKGALQLDGTASDIASTGAQAAGATGKAADAGHVHFCSGMYLCAPAVYAPASVTAKAVSTTTMAAFDSTNITTGTFTAPASGSVVVTLSCVMQVSASGSKVGLALAAHGTISPVIGQVVTPTISGTNTAGTVTVAFTVTGLTPGNSYQLDLLGCATSTVTATIQAQGQTSTSLAAASGAPVVLAVQAV